MAPVLLAGGFSLWSFLKLWHVYYFTMRAHAPAWAWIGLPVGILHALAWGSYVAQDSLVWMTIFVAPAIIACDLGIKLYRRQRTSVNA